jgi:DNA-directed RNA polymerase specialized sigma24 family protein
VPNARVGVNLADPLEVIVAHGLEGLPMRQVAGIHHMRLNTAYDRLRLGRKDLRIAWVREIL